MSKVKSSVFSALVTLVVAALGFYITLPAISIHNPTLLFDIVFLTAVYAISYMFFSRKSKVAKVEIVGMKQMPLPIKITAIVAVVCLVVWIIFALTGAVFFNASRYQKLLAVSDGDFNSDVDRISYDQIPTLDKDSAIKLGDKTMGSLSDLVSQFSVMDNYYSQINYKGTPVRVTPLEYVDVFKWINNVSNGVPGYIMINMVTQEVTLNRFSDLGTGNMKYSTAEHFNRNLYRHLRFNYPTYIFEEPTFEIDDNGIPYWVCARVNYRIGIYGGHDIGGVVLVNAVTGETTYYDIKDVPSWIDRVYNADLIIEQFDYHGMLQHGFLNSIFGQKDCQETTDGYNYIALNDDVYMYTGVTSVTSDESNIGFILTNQRTKETKFYSITGAAEFSAMSSAEGEVQNLRYISTFPLLLNIADEPTYFVALKDASGLVRMYAMINVSQYQNVATGQTLKECEANYIKLMKNLGKDPIDSKPTQSYSGIITDIRTAVIDGNSYYFFKLDSHEKTFMISVADNTEIVTYNVGDVINVFYNESDSTVIAATSITK